jgi:hypothetical protein
MHRPGVMAPPTLYEQPARPGLMSPDTAAPTPAAPPPEISLRAFFWSIVVVLGAVELCLEAALP